MIGVLLQAAELVGCCDMGVQPSNSSLARELILRYGWNATAYQIVNPGIAHWFNANRDAVVGYVRRSGVCVVAGAPICPEERLEDVVREWESWARGRRGRVCYFGAAGRIQTLLSGREGYSTVVLGAQAVWDP